MCARVRLCVCVSARVKVRRGRICVLIFCSLYKIKHGRCTSRVCNKMYESHKVITWIRRIRNEGTLTDWKALSGQCYDLLGHHSSRSIYQTVYGFYANIVTIRSGLNYNRKRLYLRNYFLCSRPLKTRLFHKLPLTATVFSIRIVYY